MAFSPEYVPVNHVAKESTKYVQNVRELDSSDKCMRLRIVCTKWLVELSE